VQITDDDDGDDGEDLDSQFLHHSFCFTPSSSGSWRRCDCGLKDDKIMNLHACIC
jgi:hypothetical protein